MIGLAQFGIVIGALGGVLVLMGLFPGVTGIDPGTGIGLVQFAAIISGAMLLDLGAILYIKHTLFVRRAATLTQQICIRLSLTGLVLAGFTGLADFLGFGSHIAEGESFFGQLQAAVMLLLLMVAAIGVLLYALTGDPFAPPEPTPVNKTATAELPIVSLPAPDLDSGELSTTD